MFYLSMLPLKMQVLFELVFLIPCYGMFSILVEFKRLFKSVYVLYTFYIFTSLNPCRLVSAGTTSAENFFIRFIFRLPELSEYHTSVFLCTEKFLFLRTELMKLLLNNPLFLLLPCVWGGLEWKR